MIGFWRRGGKDKWESIFQAPASLAKCFCLSDIYSHKVVSICMGYKLATDTRKNKVVSCGISRKLGWGKQGGNRSKLARLVLVTCGTSCSCSLTHQAWGLTDYATELESEGPGVRLENSAHFTVIPVWPKKESWHPIIPQGSDDRVQKGPAVLLVFFSAFLDVIKFHTKSALKRIPISYHNIFICSRHFDGFWYDHCRQFSSQS